MCFGPNRYARRREDLGRQIVGGVDEVVYLGKHIVRTVGMDIGGYLFGSGFGLLIVLLGWASQLTTKNKETKDLEKEFMTKAKVKPRDYQKMIRQGGKTEDSFSTLVSFLYGREEKNVEVFQVIKDIKKNLLMLDRKYNRRFWMLVCLSGLLFLTGLVSMFTPNECKFLLLLPSFLVIGFVFSNLIGVYKLENEYARNLNEAMEKL